jgi:hypothetical protein
MVESLLLLARILLAWCGASLLVGGAWICARAISQRDRTAALVALGAMLLGGALLMWGLTAP